MSEKELQNFENQKRIQRYVTDELSDAERSDFEAELKTNSNLEEELRFSEDLVFTLKNKAALDANSMYKDATADLQIEPDYDALNHFKSGNGGMPFTKWLLGGVAIILVATSAMFFTSTGLFAPSESEMLAQQFLEPFENIIGTPGNGLLAEGMEAYDKGGFSKASKLLSTYLQNDDNPPIRLYLGISQLFAEELTSAIENLEKTRATGLSPNGVAEWYLALAFLKNDEISNAIPLLESLQENEQFGEKANQVLEMLGAAQLNM